MILLFYVNWSIKKNHAFGIKVMVIIKTICFGKKHEKGYFNFWVTISFLMILLKFFLKCIQITFNVLFFLTIILLLS